MRESLARGLVMKKIKITTGILFLFVGILLIVFPFYKEWQHNKELRALEEALLLISTGEDDLDLSSIENLHFTEDEIADVMELEIPYLNLKHYILSETTDENLNIALTQIKPDQKPGEGNFTIAGHRGYRDGRHFSNLSEVPIGEKVFLHADGKTFIYQITSSEVIAETAVEVLNDNKDKTEITLITCTVSGRERVAVKGELID